MDTFKDIYKKIREIEKSTGRNPHSVELLAVSKKQSSKKIRQLWEYGQKAFGENYLQEALLKMADLHDTDINWHFIGPIQNNKTRKIAENFCWVHTIEKEKTAQRLNDQRPEHLAPLNICIQVNIQDEVTKSGVFPQEIIPLVKAIQNLPRLKLRGLMIIPKSSSSVQSSHIPFRQLNQLLNQVNKELNLSLDTLSMGMSNDYQSAIAEGATIIRLGTALFGTRE